MNAIYKPQSLFLSILYLFISSALIAQEVPKDWHLLSLEKDNVPGISLDEAYELLKANNKVAQPVIVAVLDSGVDIEHEDLKAIIWKNEDEVPGNNKDDDGNGYADDINGWNFIGNAKGESLVSETLELTRLYKKYKARFKDKDKFTITPKEKKEYEYYLQLKKDYEAAYDELKEHLSGIEEESTFFEQLIPPLQRAMKKEVFTLQELNSFKPQGREQQNLKTTFLRILERNEGLTAEKLIAHYRELSGNKEEIELRLQYNYNLEFDGRALIGDQYSNLSQRNYGNPDVTQRSEHGTHVSGIIGAIRTNATGIKGIADNSIIMPIRNTPMGDETDKDVANGIRYAVDNGAKIINMSFGKGYSPDKKVVDEALEYARKKGVLLVHGAGNDNTNTDLYYVFPSPLLENGTVVTNWIEVGASSAYADERLPAGFSNYGKKAVDIFAPGVDIYSTLPGNAYDTRSGTSMAGPVVSGVAALLLSYFPHLSPEQVKEIILESGTPYSITVNRPGSEEKVAFSSLSKTGKIVNAYKAVKLALERYDKK